ncbi:hypothetical protein [Nocardioides sp. CFH 31398]|uniref:DUF7544 domain-containing protein n=1 Tax=Nocardioides sp. CFH 31398 TaxID=2919579 RepID=UPI001F061EA8|nr:hypothetical protein [Nocardioides sp. CFH 31398]MCH1868923.1 hypothetical protein [Nocardioides sp. CFH 31398]
MAPEEQFPPPGAPPPPGPPGPPYGSAAAAPGYGAPGPMTYQGPPAWQAGPPPFAGAAHKPGAIPIRPLRLGDMYDAAFKIIRFNPRATVGSAALVAAAAMAVPVVVTLVLSATLDLSLGFLDPSTTTTPGAAPEPSDADAIGFIGAFGSFVLGALAQSVGLVLVTGMIAHVTMAAAVGRRLSLKEAWDATHGRRWRLLGLTFLMGLAYTVVLGLYIALWVVLVLAVGEPVVLVLFGIVTVPAVVALYVWAWVRLSYLAVPALMLERTGVLAALGRAFRLTRRQFWRTLGIALLTGLIAQIAGSIISFPVSLLAQLSLALPALGGYQVFVFVLGQALSTVVVAAFVSPFSAAVTSLQYVDQRMRKEALDVELLARAGITSP